MLSGKRKSRCCRPDIRHRADHCYTVTEASVCVRLGIWAWAVSFFTNQIYYYGDAHLKIQGAEPGRTT